MTYRVIDTEDSWTGEYCWKWKVVLYFTMSLTSLKLTLMLTYIFTYAANDNIFVAPSYGCLLALVSPLHSSGGYCQWSNLYGYTTRSKHSTYRTRLSMSDTHHWLFSNSFLLRFDVRSSLPYVPDNFFFLLSCMLVFFKLKCSLDKPCFYKFIGE